MPFSFLCLYLCFGFALDASLCIGGVFNATSTARSNRSHASGSSSDSSIFSDFFLRGFVVMSDRPPLEMSNISGPSREECDFILGVYMRCWGYVETAMFLLIRKLLDTDITTAQIVVRSLTNMQAQREMTLELGKYRLKKQPDVDALDKLMKRLKAAATRRNRIVHGAWILFIEMPPKPDPRPLKAKSSRWLRSYDPIQAEDREMLMRGKSQKLAAAYRFWPEQIIEDAKKASSLAEDIGVLTDKAELKPPVIPLPVEW